MVFIVSVTLLWTTSLHTLACGASKCLRCAVILLTAITSFIVHLHADHELGSAECVNSHVVHVAGVGHLLDIDAGGLLDSTQQPGQRSLHQVLHVHKAPPDVAHVVEGVCGRTRVPEPGWDMRHQCTSLFIYLFLLSNVLITCFIDSLNLPQPLSVCHQLCLICSHRSCLDTSLVPTSQSLSVQCFPVRFSVTCSVSLLF